MRIVDNGTGLSTGYAKNALHDIGRSLKKIPLDRGFRGIGRLGGLGYCEALTFTTKAKGPPINAYKLAILSPFLLMSTPWTYPNNVSKLYDKMDMFVLTLMR